jgi:predicted O-linked N-acetylglucosamine transferase (SPINDLY family)
MFGRWRLRAARKALERGEPGETKAVCTAVLAAAARPPAEAYHLLSKALLDLGELDEAEQCLNRALQAFPDDALAHNLLGMVYRAKGERDRAEASFRHALRLQRRFADAHINLGAVLTDAGRVAEAEAAFREALAEQPAHAVALCNLGLLLAENDAHAEAEQCFRKAVQSEPEYFHARLSLVVNQLREIYDDEAHLNAARAAYQAALEELRDWAARQAPPAAADAVGWITPFFLAYQGRNDRDLQATYGKLICDLMARRYPEFAAAPPGVAHRPGERLRVGFASGFFYDHSVWKNPIRGWIENLDRSRFEICGYYTGHRSDADTALARQACDRFVEGLSFEPLARAIRDDRLHALIFPEIGMDPTTVKLAALRLAPVQCTSWGHPTTSGMPSIDYFLSSALMEPPHGDEDYTETLVRLPHLSVHYTPALYPARPLARRELGLEEGSVLFFCAQSLIKYLPQYDVVFPRIARQVPDCRFLFISAHRSSRVSRHFMQRLGDAFRREGVDPARHVALLPRMDGPTFQAVARLSDIFLDSVGWSGCNSALESMACGLPAITCAGATMRARHTYAFLKWMELDELIANDPASYVALAVRFARDATWRAQMRERMLARLPTLYGDLQCVRALEDFLLRAATNGRAIVK